MLHKRVSGQTGQCWTVLQRTGGPHWRTGGLVKCDLADWRTGGPILADWRTGGLADWRTGKWRTGGLADWEPISGSPGFALHLLILADWRTGGLADRRTGRQHQPLPGAYFGRNP